MAARKTSKKRKRKSAPVRAARSRRARPQDQPRLNEQQRRDVIGVALAGTSIFAASLFYFGWGGGGLGDALKDFAITLLGRAAYVAPIAIGALAWAMIFKPVIERQDRRPQGAILVASSILLALAAGTFGLGGDIARHGYFEPRHYEVHGGMLGEGIYWGVASLLQSFGAHLTAVVTFLIGSLLLARTSVVETLAKLRSIGRRLTGRGDRGPEDAATAVARSRGAEVASPERDGIEPIVRATHVEAPALEQLLEQIVPAHDEFREDTAERPALNLESVDPDATIAVGTQSGPYLGTTPLGAKRGLVEAGHINYRLPDSKTLTRSTEPTKPDTRNQEKVAAQLLEALGHFGIEAQLVGTVAGPHITRYELQLAPGVKMAKVSQLKDDLAYALATTDIRILAPIPGKQAVGVEVPNLKRRIVHLGDIFQGLPKDWSPLSVWLGKDIAGKAIGTDLAKMPHLLVAGTTGAGKSGAINSMLSSILLRATPNECRLVLIDPKQVELNHYDDIPHLLTPVVTSPRMAANVMNNLIREMEQRYTLMGSMRTRNLIELNAKLVKEGKQPLPYILCVIDELADLMMIAPGEVEDAIIRLAQKSRAVGMHLLLATQRPSADIITGMIKANVPSRIAFAVSSQTDSRVILDQNGAESLLGQGDMLFSPIGTSRMQRIQGAYITEDEIATITNFWREQGGPEFQEELLEEREEVAEARPGELDPDADDLLNEAISLAVQMGTASTSMIQRRLRVGYTRAGRLIDMMERRGVISGYEGSKARQVLITEADLPRILSLLEERQPELVAAEDPSND